MLRMMKNKICIVVGTRPEIIKMSPIIRECLEKDLDYLLIHTNQHYSYTMDRIFFEQLELPEPRYNLEVGSGSHGAQTGKMLIELEKTLVNEEPDIVLVEGDTNTVLAAALTSSKLHIDVGHVEAGLRSYDRDMPEEINRILTDHISDFLFAPTDLSKNNLLDEGIAEKKVHVVGNTVVDATLFNLKIAEIKTRILKELHLAKGGYFLLTLHRQENVDNGDRLNKIVNTLEAICQVYKVPVIYPIHPRSEKMLRKFGLYERLKGISEMKLMEPVGYLDFLILEKYAKMVLTDSGGVQEETSILNVPCITLRYNTERPETVDIGKNMVVGVEKDRVLDGIEKMMERDLNPENPFGDGTTGRKIIEILTNEDS
jgi:UDP-N-acetylglucosamine 2-epimerase (non-hydrolysing)